jgi:hypothetical protein
MLRWALLLCPVAAVFASSEHIVATINAQANGTWRAGLNGNLDLSRLRKLLGVRSAKARGSYAQYVRKRRTAAIGDSFDARERWPGA